MRLEFRLIKTMRTPYFIALIWFATFSGLANQGFTTEQTQAKQSPKIPSKISFVKDIAPILALRCQGCHSDQKPAMGFSVSSYSKIRTGGKQSGRSEIIVDGKPDESRLLEVLLADAEPRMPLKLKALEAHEIQLIKEWIMQGAKCDAPTIETNLVSLVPPEILLQSRSVVVEKNKVPSKSATRPIVALASDGKSVAIGENEWISIFNTTTKGESQTKFGPFADQMEFIWIDPANQFIVVASGRPGLEGSVSLWNIKENKQVYRTVLHKDQILSMSVSPDSKQVATGSYDKSIAIVDLKSGRVESILKEHTEPVYSVSFGPTGSNRLASASGDRTVKTWDLKQKKRLETMSESTAELYSVAISNDGRVVYAGGVDRTIRAWDISVQPPKLIKSALAHDSAITKLMIWTDAKKTRTELISTSEDRTIRRWNTDPLKQIGESQKSTDWVNSWSSNASQVATGIYNGDVEISDWSGISPKLVWKKPSGSRVGGSPDSLKPEPFRQASLGVPSPRIIPSGRETVVTLNGLGVDQTTKIWVEPQDIQVKIDPSIPTQPNVIKVRLNVPARLQYDLARIKLATPLGITPSQSIGISPTEIKTLDILDKTDIKDIPELSFGTVIQTTITAPGKIFRAKVEAKAGETITISSLGKQIGSTLTPKIRLKTWDGKVIGEAVSTDGRDVHASALSPIHGMILVEVSDTQFSGGPGHFIVLKAGHESLAESVWPVAKYVSSEMELKWNSNTKGTVKSETKTVQNRNIDRPATQILKAPDGWISDRSRSILNVKGSVVQETQEIPFNGAGMGRFERMGQTDSFTFQSKKGRRQIIETFARRLGRDVDTSIEIVDSKGMPITAHRFRKVADTLVAFRDHTSTNKGIRLTQWADFQMGDYVLIHREIARIFTLPRNPDDDCLFFSDDNRMGFFGTTPEQHSMGRTVTKLEIITDEMESSIDPNLLLKIPYGNDDGGSSVSNDSFIAFNPPADGTYSVKVRETRGFYGPDAAYAVVVREPSPDFELQVSPMDWSISSESPKLVTASIKRLDGFDGPVDISIEGLPLGWKATSGLIESGQLSADILIELPADQRTAINPSSTWKIVGSAKSDGKVIQKTVSEMNSGWVITPKSNIKMTTSASRVTIAPGNISELTLIAERNEGFSGRIPIDVKNLPYGVRVLDIGLNGVLITEKQIQRKIRIYAEPWVKPQSRPFYAVGRAEGPGTSDSSGPVILDVIASPSAKSDLQNESLSK